MQRVARGGVFLGLGVAAGLAIAGRLAAESPAFKPPLGLENMELPIPADNPLTPGKIKLGEQLFFDTRLSKTKAMSCESCHVPEKGWADGQRFSTKADGSLNNRHTPTLYGAAYATELYWDGRAKGLEAQTLAAWKGQMGGDPEAVAKELEAIPAYAAAFQAELGGAPSGDRIVKALASFVRTIDAGDTPYDRLSKDKRAFEKSDVGQGFKVFSEVAHCTLCHLPPLFSDTLFHNIGVGFDRENPDLGRGKFLADAAAKAGQPASKQAETLQGAFKTPSLRGAAFSAPYFHDGRAETLEAAMSLMLIGGVKNAHLDEKLKPWPIDMKQRKQLMAFLRALSPEAKPYPRPTLP